MGDQITVEQAKSLLSEIGISIAIGEKKSALEESNKQLALECARLHILIAATQKKASAAVAWIERTKEYIEYNKNSDFKSNGTTYWDWEDDCERVYRAETVKGGFDCYELDENRDLTQRVWVSNEVAKDMARKL